MSYSGMNLLIINVHLKHFSLLMGSKVFFIILSSFKEKSNYFLQEVLYESEILVSKRFR